MISFAEVETSSQEYQAERELRNEILLRPIGLPDNAWEMHDQKSFHLVALSDGEVVGCVVLYPSAKEHGSAQLMQMAIREELQGQGIGTGLVSFLFDFARKENFKEIICHARENAIAFYERLGFEVYGEPFEEVGISHRHMRFAL